MGEIIDITQFSVGVSCTGIFMIIVAFRVRPSQSWESNSRLKKALLFAFGLILQIPVVIAIVSKPDVVTDTLSTEKWTYKYLLINYIIILGVCMVVYVIDRVVYGYKASR
jgi:Sec-independent protein secretion pathway component TatC